jgi:hypothetical protein
LHGPVFTDGLFEQVLGYGDLSLCPFDSDESLGAARLGLFDNDGGLGVVADLSYPLSTRSCDILHPQVEHEMAKDFEHSNLNTGIDEGDTFCPVKCYIK